MNRTCIRASRALALILTFAMAQVYVMAVPSTVPLFGRLSIAGEGTVILNGNEAASGTTLFSGAQLQTPEATGATVSLAGIGMLNVAPKTNLTVDFDRGSVRVTLASGDVLLTTAEGIKGSLTTPDGKAKLTDGSAGSSVGTTAYTGGSQDDPNKDDDSDHRCRIAGIPCALFWVLVGGGTAVSLFFAAKRGNNPSPSNP